MKIIVAVKQVPVRDSLMHIDSSGKWLEEQDLSFEINEPDAYALEAALLLKEKHGGEVVVLCAGPERAGQTIREGLAKGADRAIHVVSGDLVKRDTLGVARLLSSAIAAEKADLILTGLQSDDLGLGQTGVVMAELLGLPHATIVMEMEKREGSIRVKRELEDGWFQWVEMPLARSVNHSIRNQQTPLRHPHGHKESEDQRGPAAGCGATGGADGGHGIAGARLPAAQEEGDANYRRYTRGSGRQASGHSQVRGARAMNGVLVVLEYRSEGGRTEWNRISWEALAAGQELAVLTGQSLVAALPGSRRKFRRRSWRQRRWRACMRVEHALLASYTSDGVTLALEQLVHSVQPSYVVFPHTYQVRDFAPRLAARLRADAHRGHSRYPHRRAASGLRAAVAARQVERRLSPLGGRTVLYLDAGRRVPAGDGGIGLLRGGGLPPST